MPEMAARNINGDPAFASSKPPLWLSHDRGGLTHRDRRMFLIACGLLYFAQSFAAWVWPALDGYPAIERWLDPSFLPTDFYTNTTGGYGVDTWQAVLFGTIQRWTGVHYALQIAILTALRHIFWPWVLYRFFKHLLRDEDAALLGAMLGVLADFTLPNPLGWSWLWGDGCPAMMAVFTMTIAWTEMLRHRAWSGFILLGLATIMQPLVGVHGGILAAVIFLFGYTSTEKAAALKNPANYIGAFIFLAIFAWQYVSLEPPGTVKLPAAEYINILVYERHPGDFLLSRMSLRDWADWGLGIGAILLMASRIWHKLPRPGVIGGGLAIYALICLAGYVFVELYPLRAVVDIIPFRTVSIGAPLLLAIIAFFCAQQMRAGRWVLIGAYAIAFALAGLYGGHLHLPRILPSVLLFLVTVVATLLPATGEAAAATPARIGQFWRFASVALFALSIPACIERREEMRLPNEANQHPVYAWAHRTTPPGARFLVEQNSSSARYTKAISPQLMRLVGRRAVVASRDFPFRDSWLRPWYQTWAVALDHNRLNRVETATVSELRAICTTLPYDYVVRAHPLPANSFPEVARFGPANGLDELHIYRVCG